MLREGRRLVFPPGYDLQAVTEAVNKGKIYKFLTKPWDSDELRETVRKAFLYKEAQR